MDDRVSLDLFEEFCRVARDNGLSRATLGGMSIEFAPPAPPVHFAEPLQPLPNDGPATDPPEQPINEHLPPHYRRLFGRRPAPSFQRKD